MNERGKKLRANIWHRQQIKFVADIGEAIEQEHLINFDCSASFLPYIISRLHVMLYRTRHTIVVAPLLEKYQRESK